MMRINFLVLCSIVAGFHVALGASVGTAEVTTQNTPSTVQAIFSMFRHGDRTPISFWPNDPYLNYDWPGGHGALSVKGVAQLYTLGINLRHRYKSLLPADGRYSQHNILVTSSYKERCIMSGLSLLAGFMPPQEGLNHLPISWQPVPITSLPQFHDKLLAQDRNCTKYNRELQDLYRNPPADLKKLKEENKDLFKLVERSGRTNISFRDIGEIYDTLIIQRDNNFTLPEWSKNIFPERMRPFAERAYSVWTETPYMKKVKGGAFVTEVYHKMVNKAKKLDADRKIFFYASHDSTIIGVLNSLGVLHQAAFLPQYGAMFVFELHTNLALNDDLEVKLVYYANTTIVYPKELYLPNCSSPCSLTKFGVAVNHLLHDEDYDKLCENVQSRVILPEI